MPTNFITLPRSQLYELVWTKPVTELAKEFGISDVALAKRCRNLNIPLPPRGYWARVAAGQKPKRPPLPKYHEMRSSRSDRPGTETTEPTVSFDPSHKGRPPRAADDSPPPLSTSPTADLDSASSLVKRTARHYRHPRRAELEFPRGESHGPILRLHVSPDSLERALLVADRFLRACVEQGWTPIPPKQPEPPDPRHYYGRPPEPPKKTGPHHVDLDVDGQRIEFQIEERCEHRELPPTQAELNRQKRDSWFRPEKRYETLWSGRLRLKRPNPGYPYRIDGKSWFETANRSLDDLIPKIIADFRAVATHIREVDEQREREARERERLAKLAAELEDRRKTNAERAQTLESEAGAWHRARYLRRYLRALRRAPGSTPPSFLDWAEHYIDQLDPLHPTPRDPDCARPRDIYYRSEEKLFAEELNRLLGRDWERTEKTSAPATDITPEDTLE